MGKLDEIFRKPMWFVAIGLVLAFADSYATLERLTRRSLSEHNGNNDNHRYGGGVGAAAGDRVLYDLDKQRSYRAQRNIYLTGFALTLLFVINRISQLMQESVEMEEQIHRLSATTTISVTSAPASASTSEGGGTTTIEMTELPPKKKKGINEKKRD